jgi:hypothetical protein
MAMRKELTIPEDLFILAKEEFECNWINRKVVIKRFTFGDQVQIQQDSMKVKATAISQTADVNVADLQVLTLMRAVVEAPWLINDLNAIKSLPPMLADWLKQEIEELNTITVKKKEN